MKKIICLILMSFLFINCNDSNVEKKVFYGFELGKGFNFNKERLDELVRIGLFKTNNDNYPYLVNNINGIGEYYASPFFLTIPGDTIVGEIQVLYSMDVVNLRTYLDGLHNNSLVMNLPQYASGGLTPINIREDVINNLTKTYGNYDKKDTINHQGYKELYEWKDKDGLDIQLNYFYDKSFNNLTSILLKYRYSDEIREKLLKNKTGY